MTSYLVQYNRATRQAQVESYADDRRAALRARLAIEMSPHDSNIEAVVLSATSEDDIRRTHPRYFESAEELAAHPVK